MSPSFHTTRALRAVLYRFNHSDDHGGVAPWSAGTRGHGDIGKHLRTVGGTPWHFSGIVIEGYITNRDAVERYERTLLRCALLDARGER